MATGVVVRTEVDGGSVILPMEVLTEVPFFAGFDEMGFDVLQLGAIPIPKFNQQELKWFAEALWRSASQKGITAAQQIFGRVGSLLQPDFVLEYGR